jgi:hypothetical protein
MSSTVCKSRNPGARRRLSSLLIMLMLSCAAAWAQSPFQIGLPVAGALVPAGQPIAIMWSGGEPTWNAAIQLVDVASGSVVGGVGPFPNSGVLFWTIPTSLAFGGPCGRTYRFYVQNVPQTQWHYGPVFTAICPTGSQTFNIANGDVAGLIAAINSANSTPDPDVINLAPGGSYTLTAASQVDGFTGDTGLPFVVRPLTIRGFGATIRRSSAAGTPDFRVAYAIHTDLTLEDVVIAGGRGGASQRGGGGLGIIGGTLIVKNSTITQNHALALGGGGIANICSLLIVENSTISHNTAAGGRTGGGILNESGGTLCTGRALISNSTIFENRAIDGRGDALADAFSPAGHVVVKNSVLASPTQGIGGDCIFGFAPDSKGYNIASDASCQLFAIGDMNSADPGLGPLANNGGPTPTHLPLGGSPVVDAIPAAACTSVFGDFVTADQRGVARPQGLACDRGSVDVSGDTTGPLITPSISGLSGNAGWYRGPVTVSFTVADPESGISWSGCAGSTVIPFDTPGLTLVCSATNGAGISGSASVTIKIDQTPPVANSATANPNPVPANAPVLLSANLSDSGSGLATAKYTVNGSAPATLAAATGASASVTGPLPAFATPGVYNVCVFAVDVAGNTGLPDCALLAVYDPNGGFVTGGGWINSPAGAYTANSSLAGKATFGFESKYQTGAAVPTGNTQFLFRLADLNFKSTSYDWLVVAGSRAKYKGFGTINGVGNYGFMLSAIDGDLPGGDNVDRFRIKITGAGGVVYDNQIGGGDDDDPSMALGGGSIVIHK